MEEMRSILDEGDLKKMVDVLRIISFWNTDSLFALL